MIYKVSDLKRDVRIILDQNKTSEQLVETDDIDTLSLEDIIESKIVNAAKIVESNAPTYMLGAGCPFADSIGWVSRVGIGGGYISLPDDFMRLVSFQMSDWSRPVSVVITEDDPLYAQQSSRFPGIRGCPQNPVVAITSQPVGLVLEFYSCTQGDKVYVKRARYIPLPKIVNGEIELCEKLKPAIVYCIASLAAASIGEPDLASYLSNISNQLQQ